MACREQPSDVSQNAPRAKSVQGPQFCFPRSHRNVVAPRSFPILFCMFLMHLFVASTGCRIGEASNPGPSTGHHTIAIGTANPTGLVNKGHLVRDLPRGCWGFSETHITQAGLAKFRSELHFRQTQANFVHGKFAPAVSQSPGTYGGKSTGVGVMSHHPLRSLTQEWPEHIYATGRLHAAATLIGSSWMKLGVAYGYAKNPHLPATVAQTDEVLAHLTDRIVFQSYGYRVIMGDFNNPQRSLPQFDVWRREGWVELQEYAQAKWGRPIQCTFKDISTIDMVWISPELVPLLQEVTVDPSFFSEHAVVWGSFSFPPQKLSVPVWRKPFPLPRTSIAEEFSPEIVIPPTVEDSDDVIQHVFHEVEQAIDMNLRAQKQPGLLPQQKGRCATKAPSVKHHEVTPLKPGHRGSPEIKFHGENFQYTKWVRQLRRLHSLCLGLRSNSESSAHQVHMKDLWDSIRAAPGFPQGFPKAWQSRSTVLPGSPACLPRKCPNAKTAELIYACFEADFRGYEKLLRKHRATQAKERRQADPSVIYKDVRKAQSLPVQTVVLKHTVEIVDVSNDGLNIQYAPHRLHLDEPVWTPQGFLHIADHLHGSITTVEKADLAVGDLLTQTKMIGDLPGIFSAFHDLWHPIWNRHQDMDISAWDSTIQQIRDLPQITSGQCVFPPIDMDTWIRAVTAKKPHSAVGPDGVSREDLLRLPPQATQHILDMLADIEAGRREWPQSILVGHITAIEKHGAAASPSDYRPICVLSMVYRTWGTIRSKQMLAWLDKFAPAHLTGNRPGHATMDVWFELALMVERASHDDDAQVAGLVTDVCKCFNTLHRGVVYACARKCGFDAAFLAAWFSAASKVQRCFVVSGACSDPVGAVTGFPEGDPLSVVSMACINMILHAWVGSQIKAGDVISYVDNWEIVTPQPEMVADAWQTLQQFANSIDVKLDCQNICMGHQWALPQGSSPPSPCGQIRWS